MNISFIGLGTVGMYYSGGLMAHGAPQIKGFDIMVGNPNFGDRAEACRKIGIDVVDSVEKVIENADIIMVVTTAATAINTAESAKPYLKKGQIYVELNSAVPSVKKKIEMLLDGIDVIDGTTMSDVNSSKYNSLVNFSGKRAKEVVDTLAAYGMKAKYVGDMVGNACAIKVVRSIFMKGWEAITMECVHAAYYYDVVDEVLDSISEFFELRTMKEHFNSFVNTDAIFAKRRGEEIDAIAMMLFNDGIDNKMSIAAKTKLAWIASLGLSEHYNNEIPNNMLDVIQQIHIRSTGRN